MGYYEDKVLGTFGDIGVSSLENRSMLVMEVFYNINLPKIKVRKKFIDFYLKKF